MDARAVRTGVLAAVGLGLWSAWAIARRARAWSLRGKTVLITGGSRGLGLVLAREFAREGARLVICGREPTVLEHAREDLERLGAEVLAVPTDVTLRDEVALLVTAATQRFGGVDVLVNNAGRIDVGPLDSMTEEDFERAMATHFWGPLHLMRALAPGMRERGGGRIVNIASIGGLLAVPHLVPYSASKFALAGLSEGMTAELARDGVRVTTVYPGLMRTGSARNANFKGRHREEYAWFVLSDALPLASMGAERAARKIVAACRRGDVRLVLSIPAKLAALLHGIAPGFAVRALTAVNGLLPEPGGLGTGSRKGYESSSAWTDSALTSLDDAAAEANHENLVPSFR
ncbi:MAG: SDR family oxidoreductase [Myxococcales bacterium]|nr:SDR family oxidoreductase [Myxococcales bacterium]